MDGVSPILKNKHLRPEKLYSKACTHLPLSLLHNNLTYRATGRGSSGGEVADGLRLNAEGRTRFRFRHGGDQAEAPCDRVDGFEASDV